MLKSLGKSLSLQHSCLQDTSQVDGAESVHGADLAVQRANSDICVEESKPCTCNHINIEDVESAGGGTNIGAKHDAEANSSFAYAVINMAGMLIGNQSFA